MSVPRLCNETRAFIIDKMKHAWSIGERTVTLPFSADNKHVHCAKSALEDVGFTVSLEKDEANEYRVFLTVTLNNDS